jgi:hypothetical protein
MTISRRNFVSASVLAAAATLSVPGVFAQSFKERDGNPGEVPAAQTDPLANYSKASFASYLNSIFQIQTARGVVEVSLARVDDMPAPKGGECFSLLFRGGSIAVKQDTYVVVHPALGTFQLLLVPGGSDQNGAHEYCATINRISPADLANLTAPSRRTGGQSSNSPFSSPTSSPNSTSPSSSTSTIAPTVVTSPAVTQTSVAPASAPVASPTRHRKRKPSRKRVDSKTPFID